MTREELREIIDDAQRGAMGCGCCASIDDQIEELEKATNLIWEEFEKLKMKDIKRRSQ